MQEYIISKHSMNEVLCSITQNPDYSLLMPDEANTRYSRARESVDVDFSGQNPPVNISPKEYLLPRTEPVLYYKRSKTNLQIIDPEPLKQTQILWGVKPCDASAFQVIKKVFNWDYKDELFNRKLDQTIIVGQVCRYRDSDCFCSSVGSSPVTADGSDIFLIPIDNLNCVIRFITEKGLRIFEIFKEHLQPANGINSTKLLSSIEEPEIRFDYTAVKKWLDSSFENDFWLDFGNICMGCARCAYVCPTCHCFDLVDESSGYTAGRRMKNWDACQFSAFTQHASGHNPRESQPARYRQRISHKFKYYQDRFGEILCTGCGRCSRGCPVNMNLGSILTKISDMARG